MPRSRHRSRSRTDVLTRAARGSQLWLGVAVAAANILGYASIVVISATFGPAEFGAVGALTSLGVIAGIPAGTLMVVVAGRVGRGESVSWAYGLSLVIGVAQALVLIAASVVLIHVLDLDSVWPLIWLGLTLIPITVFSAQQGLLLGARRTGRLSVLFTFSGLARLAAAAVCAIVHPTVGTAYAAWLAAAVLTSMLGLWLCRDLSPLHGMVDGMRRHLVALGKASFALLALITLTSIDTIFARHLLSARDSGIYSVASIFAKVIFWGTQFIAMVTVPKLARRPGRFLVLKAYAAVLVVSVPVVVVIAIDPLFWLTSVGLDKYQDAANLLVRFAGLGILWSLIQVSIFADMSGNESRTSPVIWIGLALQTALTFTVLGSTPTQIWLAAVIAAAFVTCVTLARLTMFAGDRHAPSTTGPDGNSPLDG